MKFSKLFLSILIAAMGTSILMASPADRTLRSVTQPDGTTLKIRKVGDENLHFTVTEDGLILKEDEDGWFWLGRVEDDGALVSTGVLPSDPSAYSIGTNIQTIDAQKLKAKRKSKQRAPQSEIGLVSTTFPRKGQPRALIILVEYQDVKFSKAYDPKEFYEDMINGDNFTQYGGTGSAKKYFEDQSGGQFVPQFDIYGPVTLPQPMKYYGGNTQYGAETNSHLMVTDAMDILDNDVNFALYDTDKDGIIDNVYIFYAGKGEDGDGGPDTVWPYSWDIRGAGITKYYDNVLTAHFACSNEWTGNRPEGIGTFIHEFSHVMGLPDLYNTFNPNLSYTPAHYTVLDYAQYNNEGRTPCNYSAYEKNALGWYEPIILDHSMEVTLESIDSGQFGLIPTSKNTEFFLIENRQQAGWDKYIRNHGMLIWHIDYDEEIFTGNRVNNSASHPRVDIVKANNIADLAYEAGWTWPGSSGKTEFSVESTPMMITWDGEEINLPVQNITEHDGLISFNIDSEGLLLVAPKPVITDMSGKDMYFNVEWEPVEAAIEYSLSVYGRENVMENVISVDFSNNSIPAGWEASSAEFSITSGSFGEKSPSFKFGKDAQTLTSNEIAGDITEMHLWIKGQNTTDGKSYLLIEGFSDGKWIVLTQYIPKNNKAEEIHLVPLPAGVHQVRFTFSKSVGAIVIDDIKLIVGGSSHVLKDYDNISLGLDTSIKIDKLIQDVYDYYFIVSSTDGRRTKLSETMYVVLPHDDGDEDDPSLVGEIDMNENAETIYFNLQGVPIMHPVDGQLLIMKRGNKAKKIIYKE